MNADQTAIAARPAYARGGERARLMISLLIANAVVYTVNIGVAGVLLPTQIAMNDPEGKTTTLGLVTGIGAVVATLTQPIVGSLSDRSGRRKPWIIGGAVAALLVFVVASNATTLLWITIGWAAAQIALNVYQAAVTAVVPDRIAPENRGTASALFGLGLPVGITVGVAVASSYAAQLGTGYTIFGIVIVCAAVLYTVMTRERRIAAEAIPLREQVTGFAQALRTHDFRWAFVSRALLILGYFSVVNFQLYILMDYIDLPADLPAVAATAIVTPITGVATVVSTLAAGWMSDRFQRRKVFVFASAVTSGVALLMPLLMPNWTGMLLFGALVGIGFGAFMAVDTAIATLVLPSKEHAARDMGVLNIASAAPQALAPMLASLVIGALGGYPALFVAAAVFALLGAVAILPVRGVR
ncbi:MFS transporter [Microbacterium halotolerans]|uniref:MFS transporter n=1 Tax=Microbacterium halotolerans TaxID=246613 RepID=UPI000E6ACB85|nr:MFS transporter [Microbacterium halotolerans]